MWKQKVCQTPAYLFGKPTSPPVYNEEAVQRSRFDSRKKLMRPSNTLSNVGHAQGRAGVSYTHHVLLTTA
jgi:hypothetical protein